ncbi:MAG TPA: lipocalin-like domain-containing protein [archaeon]|nr:lipocalin-like domain-containing protein [archaeon]
MKSSQILLLISVCALFACTAGEKKNEIEGVWELVSAKYTTPDTTFERTQADWTAIKIITSSHFATVGQKPDRPKFGGEITDSDYINAYNTFSANGGTYTLEGDTYTEHLRFFSNPNRVNESASIKYQFDGDQLILSTEAGDVIWREVWSRVK